MNGKSLFAVLTAVFIVPENSAYASEVAPIYKWYQNVIDTALDKILKQVYLVDKPFADALNVVEVKLKVEGTPQSQKILHNAEIQQKGAMISAHKILYYLKSIVASSFIDLEKHSSNITKEMESDMQKKLLKDGWSLEKVENCSQKYKNNLNMATVLRIQDEAGCIMNLVDEGQLILQESVRISDEIKQLLIAITGNKDQQNIERFLGDITQLYIKFPIVKAYAFIENQITQQQTLLKCYDLKAEQRVKTVTASLDKIIECTTGQKPKYN